jgi:hypothetical protein
MYRSLTWRSAAVALALFGAGCSAELDVENPNAPDRERAFSDPATISAVAGGSIRTWLVNRQEYNGGLLLNSMADGYTASWNNFNLRYYTSEGFECPVRCGWVNNQTSSFYPQLETFWYGYYSALSGANDALTAIRLNNVIITDEATTRMVEAISVLMQGVVFGGIATSYDQGFIVDESTDLSDPLAIPIATREEMRDAAIAKLEEASQIAAANAFQTPATWTGLTQGVRYSNDQIARLAKTLAAQFLAHSPRTAAENAQVPWGQVATLAAAGISSGTPFDFGFFQDLNVWYDGTKNWGNDVTTMRVDTRLAAVITAGPDPAKVHVTPWPGAPGNPIPDAFDARVGNGSWGPEDDFLGAGTYAEDAGAGTDFAYAASNPFPSARGVHHYSQLGHIRYSYLAYPGYGLPTENGTGFAPVIPAAENDLLWAEGLIRSGGNKATAAALINKTRVGRGGLSALTGGESDAELLNAVAYESDIELLAMGPTYYFNRRRRDALPPMTPRHMPIPAKELSLLALELYTFGGPDNPAGLSAPAGVSLKGVKNVRERWAEIEARSRAEMKARRRR